MDRPAVVLHVCASLDGRITFAPNTTIFSPQPEAELFCTRQEWQDFHDGVCQHHQPDMFLEGSNMLVAENQPLAELPAFVGDATPLYQDFLPNEIVERQGRTTWTSVVDGRGRFRNGYTAATHDPSTYMIHLVSEAVPSEYLAFLRARMIPYLIEGKQRVDLKGMLRKVKRKLGVNTILTSSGGKLSGALIRESLLDEINLLLCPVVIGGYATPTLFASPEIDWTGGRASKLSLVESRKIGDDKVWLRYRVPHDSQHSLV